VPWHNAAVTRLARLRSAVAPYRTAILTTLLAGAIVVNIVQFPGIERGRFREMQAIGRYDTADIAAFTYRTCGWCRQRYGLYLALGTLAPGARVIIPTPSAYTADRGTSDEIASRLRAFGRVGSIAWARSDAAAGPGIDPTQYVLVSGNGGTKGAPWLFAVDPRFRPAGGVPDPDRYLNGIVTGEGPARAAVAREFALIRWARPRTGSTYAYQELLVETSLLPETLRKGLAG
jgi:hypothetical protein